MKKRIFSWFLTLVMVLGMVPVTALAEEPVGGTYSVGIEEQEFVSLLAEDTEDGEESQNNGTPAELTQSEPSPVETAKEAKINALLHNIAASYVDSSYEWHIMEMAAYEDLFPDSEYKTSDKARQEYIDKAIASVVGGNVGDTTYDKAIICLTALGVDAEKLYTINSNEPISAVEGLKGNGLKGHSTQLWDAPYTLMAYGQNNYRDTKAYEIKLISDMVQNVNGSWGGNYDNGIQSTANMIAGLAFYSDIDGVEDAIDKAVDFLSVMQNAEDGKFYDYTDADANTAAMAVIGLCAAGVNPDTDTRFIKNGTSVLDALLSFAFEDNTCFKYDASYTDKNNPMNVMATEQAFRALIAAKQMMDTGKAFNIYDFSHNSKSLKPGRATGSGSVSGPSAPPEENEDITVTVTIRPDVGYWMRNKSVTVDKGSTVYHAFVKALEGSGITQEGAESGYVSEMSYGGETLGEFDKGENSGWLYKVNGELPDVGLTSYEIEDGDRILWYYTEDWTKDPDAGSRREEEIEKENKEAAKNVSDLISGLGEISLASKEAIEAARAAYDALTEEQKKLVDIEALLQAEEAYAALMAAAEEETGEVAPAPTQFTDVQEESYYYDAVNWAAANGIVSGVAEDAFAPEETCSRGQIAAFLWRLAGCPAPATKVVPYTDVETDSYYHDAILWAAENGIVKGMDGLSFGPETVLTRAQAVTFLWRAMGSPAPLGEYSFGDVPETAYYRDAVLWAAENGITSGTGADLFSPDAPCQRGQIVTFLYRAFEK